MNQHGNLFFKKYGLFLILSLIFLSTVMITFQVRLYGDDFFYAQFPPHGLRYFISKHIEHYFRANGRVIVHLLATIFLGLPLPLWQIINPLMLVGIAYYGSKTAFCSKAEQSFTVYASIIFGLGIGFLHPNMTRESVYWLTGSFNYVYPLLMLLIYWYQLSISIDKNQTSWFLPLLGFLSAATVEQVSLMTFGLTLCVLFEKAFIQKKKLTKMHIITLVTTTIGMLTVIAAPGIFLRVSIEDAPTTGFINLLKYNIKKQGTTFLFSNIMMPYHIFAMVAAFGSILKNRTTSVSPKKWWENIILIISSSACISWLWQVSIKAGITNYNILSKRQFFFYLYITTGYLMTLFYAGFLVYKNKIIVNRTLPIITIILCFGSQLMMLISPVYGPRNLVVAIFMLLLYAAALIPTLHTIGLPAICACVACFLLSKPSVFPFAIAALLFIYDHGSSYKGKFPYRKIGILGGYVILLIVSFSTWFPTLKGYAKNATAYDQNIKMAQQYKVSQAIKKTNDPLVQTILPIELYGWAMPYHNPYYDPYYRLYLGVDIKTDIDWESN